jgi:ribosomal protein S11
MDSGRPPADAGNDSGPQAEPDSGPPDSGATAESDSGPGDGVPSDSGPADSGSSTEADSGPADSGTQPGPDAGPADSGPTPEPDAGPADSGFNDAGPGVTTLAGNGTAGWFDGTGGPDGTSEFWSPYGVAVDSLDRVVVADSINNRIRIVSASGNATTLAGTGTPGYMNGPNDMATFDACTGVALTTTDVVYVADMQNSWIRKISTGTVSTATGEGGYGFMDGAAATAEFEGPFGVAVDASGNVYIADSGNCRIRVLGTDGQVTTLAGNGTQGFMDGTGGPTGTAEFYDPEGVAVSASGIVYVTDTFNNSIRQIDQNGNVTTVAGNGTQGYMDGTGGIAGTAEFNWPTGIAVDAEGYLYVGDWQNNRVRMIDPSGNVTTLAGNGTYGFVDGTLGPTGTTEFKAPQGVAVDSQGRVYVADEFNNRIRLITR